MSAHRNVTGRGALVGGDAAEELLAVAAQLLDALQQPILGRLWGHRQLGQLAVLAGNLSQEVSGRLEVAVLVSGAGQDHVLLVHAQRIAGQALVQSRMAAAAVARAARTGGGGRR